MLKDWKQSSWRGGRERRGRQTFFIDVAASLSRLSRYLPFKKGECFLETLEFELRASH
jgi:hypothetical protein